MIMFLAWAMILTFLALVITKKLHPFTALIVVPLVFVLIGAFMGLYANEALAETLEISVSDITIWNQVVAVSDWAIEGLTKTSSTAFMLLFAILFFAIMLNAGLFDPVTGAMIKLAKGDPLKVVVASAVVAAVVSLNGDGTTTTLICCTAFIPLYKRLKMRMMNLAVVVILMNTIMNLLPWGGPTARAISVIEGVGSGEILGMLAPGMVLSVIYMLGVSYYLGLKERKRLGITKFTDVELAELATPQINDEEKAMRRPKLVIFNAILTIGAIALLVRSPFKPAFIFLVATVIALLVNYPKISDQKARIQDNAGDALQVVILVIGAGMFTGLFTSSGMSDAIAQSMIDIIPVSLGRFWGLITAVFSAPGTFFLSNDAYYYGVLPAFAEAGLQYGFTGAQIATASLLGQAFHLLSPLTAFIYLLLAKTEVDMGAWQKEAGKWAIGIFVIFIAVAALVGSVPLFV